MEPPQKSQSALFQVYLRLRPPPAAGQLFTSTANPDRFLTVEEAEQNELPTHITLNPPNDNRRRAVEKFAFTKVFEENSNQLDIFQGTGVLPLVEGVLGPHGGEGRDGLLATLGVTGSGKSHTILGSRTQRGLTQLALDVLFRSIATNILDPATGNSLHATIAASDPTEAQVMSASMFLDTIYGDSLSQTRAGSRAQTPMVIRSPSKEIHSHPSCYSLYPTLLGLDTGSPKSIRVVKAEESLLSQSIVSIASSIPGTPSFMRSTTANARKKLTKSPIKGESYTPVPTPRRHALQRPSASPNLPDISNLTVEADQHAEYAIVISMYEVYNDRIFDLLTPALPGKSTKDFRRRALLFKSTEQSPDRKIVAGLRKIICGSMREALMVLEAGLHERRVAGTGSNSVSSRSHGFFCVEVKKRKKSRMPGRWGGSTLTIVDLAGSERARDAKTQGQTLQEAGKINESLMYLGQCLQMQTDLVSSTKPNLVPFRQCKLTELLFSNSFPSYSSSTTQQPHLYQSALSHRNPQKAIMIVTADPLGDFNATSQILRYSALAREVTVPRIPSVSSTILAQSTSSCYFNQRPSSRGSPTDTERETMEIAALEIARMSEEIDGLRSELLVEQERRLEVEAHLESARAECDQRVEEKEADVREECYLQMEEHLQREMQRWKATWALEQELGDEHLDRKLDILTRGIDAGGDDKENHASADAAGEDLAEENQRLRRDVELLTRQLHARSPTRQSARRGSPLAELSTGQDVRVTSVSPQGSPLKKPRKITARKWDIIGQDELL